LAPGLFPSANGSRTVTSSSSVRRLPARHQLERAGRLCRRKTVTSIPPYRFVPEATTRIAALQTGEVQLASTIPASCASASRSARISDSQVFPVGGTYIIVNSQYGLTRTADQAGDRRGDRHQRDHRRRGRRQQAQSLDVVPGTPYDLGKSAPTPWYDIKDRQAKDLLKAGRISQREDNHRNQRNYVGCARRCWCRRAVETCRHEYRGEVSIGRPMPRTCSRHRRMEPVDHAVRSRPHPRHTAWRPMIYAFRASRATRRSTPPTRVLLRARLERRRGSWLKISNSAGQCLHDQDRDSGG